MTIICKPAAGFPDYLVYSDGRVTRATAGKCAKRYPAGAVLQGTLNPTGYRVYNLLLDGVMKQVRANRLVLETFCGPPPSPHHEAAHGDGDRLNNALANLRWATRIENEADKLRHGTTARGARHGSKTKPETFLRGEQLPQSKLRECDVQHIRTSPLTGAALAVELRVSPTLVSAIRRRKAWRHV